MKKGKAAKDMPAEGPALRAIKAQKIGKAKRPGQRKEEKRGWYVTECFARDVLRYVIEVWGIPSYVNVFLDEEVCLYSFNKMKLSLAALMQKKGRSSHDLLVVLDLSVRTPIKFFIRYMIYLDLYLEKKS